MHFQFHWYGFFVGLGIAVAILLFEKVTKKEKISTSIDRLALWIFIPGLLGARLYHLITDWSLYTHASLIELIAVWNGGIGVIGAVIGGVSGLLGYVYFTKQSKNLWLLLDIGALCLPFAQAIGRWGNYFNQELYGQATTMPWGIHIDSQHLLPGLNPNAKYHPLFLYESVLMVLFGLLIWHFYQQKRMGVLGRGQYFSLYLMYYSTVRFGLEFLRAESSRMAVFPLSLLTVAQWVMVGVFIMSAVVFAKKIKNDRYSTRSE